MRGGDHPAMAADRTLVVRYPDWSALAAGYRGVTPVVVMEAGRVATVSAAARTEGVTVGLRRREAQSRCPGLAVVERDVIRDLRAWEPAVAAVEALAPTVEVQA
ncbi:MAG: DNA polymerase Y family protein, partial [Actinomycetes bacterium]